MSNLSTYPGFRKYSVVIGALWVAMFSFTVVVAEVVKTNPTVLSMNSGILNLGAEEENKDERNHDNPGEEELENDEIKGFTIIANQLAGFYQSGKIYYHFTFSELHPDNPQPPPDFISIF